MTPWKINAAQLSAVEKLDVLVMKAVNTHGKIAAQNEAQGGEQSPPLSRLYRTTMASTGIPGINVKTMKAYATGNLSQSVSAPAYILTSRNSHCWVGGWPRRLIEYQQHVLIVLRA